MRIRPSAVAASIAFVRTDALQHFYDSAHLPVHLSKSLSRALNLLRVFFQHDGANHKQVTRSENISKRYDLVQRSSLT